MLSCACGYSKRDLPFYGNRKYLEYLFEVSITESRRQKFWEVRNIVNEYLEPYTNLTNPAYPAKDPLSFQAYQPE